MCEKLSDIKEALWAIATAFRDASVSPAELDHIVEDSGAIEKTAASIGCLAAARRANCGGPKGGERQAADALAHATGSTLAEARRALEVGKRMGHQPELWEAARAGHLSRLQAALVSDAIETNPEAGPVLLAKAKASSLSELAAECARAKAARTDVEERRRQVHASRSLRWYSDAFGTFHLHASGTLEDGAKVVAALRPLTDQAFASARKEGRRERPEAYAFDALVALATSGGAGTPRGEVVCRVDHSALLRGYAADGEVCEIAGFGPTSVQAVRDVIETGDPFLKAVVTKGKDVVGVAHLGRRPNVHQKTALDWLFPTCAAQGCGTRADFLETDHRVGWARSHITVLDLLDRLCRFHHGLKTYQGWALVEGRGKRPFVPKEDPRHPQNACRQPQ